MKGTELKLKCGYNWMRIGHAGSGFSAVFILAVAIAVVCLGYWAFQEMRPTGHVLVSFLAIYAVAVIFYMNAGVWLHEQLHCLAYLGSVPRRHIRACFERKYILALSGHYRVNVPISYRVQKRALLAPLILCGGFVISGWLGSFILPGWWLPVMLTLAVASLADMLHDIYMVMEMSPIGDKGRYWDKGSEIHVVWQVVNSGD